MIEFKNVNKAYKGKNNVLNGLDLKVEDGEFVFITGATGAGKSTLIKLLLREEKADSGKLIVNGQDLRRMPAYKIPKYRRRIGVVFQDFRLFPKMTVAENIAFALNVVGTPKREIDQKVKYILRTVELEGKEHRMPDELSGGEKQRVALARALVNSPDIILADEPTGNIDPQMSRSIMDLLVNIHLLRKTVIVVTHEREIIKNYNMRTVLLENGKIKELNPCTRKY